MSNGSALELIKSIMHHEGEYIDWARAVPHGIKAEFRMGKEEARRVMMTAHQRGACVVAVFTKDVAETKAMRASVAAHKTGCLLQFTTKPEGWMPQRES
jgi:hypothetical protein